MEPAKEAKDVLFRFLGSSLTGERHILLFKKNIGEGNSVYGAFNERTLTAALKNAKGGNSFPA